MLQNRLPLVPTDILKAHKVHESYDIRFKLPRDCCKHYGERSEACRLASLFSQGQAPQTR